MIEHVQESAEPRGWPGKLCNRVEMTQWRYVWVDMHSLLLPTSSTMLLLLRIADWRSTGQPNWRSKEQ